MANFGHRQNQKIISELQSIMPHLHMLLGRQSRWLHYGNNASASSIGQLPEARKIVETPYYFDAYSHEPRYYQRIAIDRTVEAVAKGQKRILLVMATGTGKTFTSFQIIHRLTKSGAMKLEKLAYMLNY